MTYTLTSCLSKDAFWRKWGQPSYNASARMSEALKPEQHASSERHSHAEIWEQPWIPYPEQLRHSAHTAKYHCKELPHCGGKPMLPTRAMVEAASPMCSLFIMLPWGLPRNPHPCLQGTLGSTKHKFISSRNMHVKLSIWNKAIWEWIPMNCTEIEICLMDNHFWQGISWTGWGIIVKFLETDEQLWGMWKKYHRPRQGGQHCFFWTFPQTFLVINNVTDVTENSGWVDQTYGRVTYIRLMQVYVFNLYNFAWI